MLAVAFALLAGCGGGGDSRLLIVTTNDVTGKTSPCGCHTPKGGLARRATFLDSVRAVRKRVLVVDAGGFFPDTDDEREAGPYMLQTMGRMGTQAAGVGANELRFGYAFVRENARSAGVPLVCANLSRADGTPAFERWRVLDVAGTKVGVFGLISENSDLGPARDSLRLEGAAESARRAIAALHAQGAGMIVLLSQLGKDAGDTLTVHVPGMDLVVGGGGVPALRSGVGMGRAIAVYGGSQGWQVGVVDVRLGGGTAARTPVLDAFRDIEARTLVLGPEVRDDVTTATSVKAFEDSLNAHLKWRAAAFGPGPVRGSRADHYVGMSNCTPCHAPEFAQWQTTAHARAWQTLADLHKESTPACLPCHVTGFVSPGGFQTADDWARFGNVQCEACHGMGSHHNAWAQAGNKVLEATCRGCHTETTSPTFTLADYRPHILHAPPPGLRPLPETPAHRLMRAGKAPHGH